MMETMNQNKLEETTYTRQAIGYQGFYQEEESEEQHNEARSETVKRRKQEAYPHF